MFIVNRIDDNRLDIEMDGKLNAQDMLIALDQFVSGSEGVTEGRMLCDIIDYQLPTLDAILLELKRMPELFTIIKQYKKAAVLSDQAWVKVMSELEGKLIPNLEIKAFSRLEREEAEKWLALD
ncbi:hypothetical protein BCU68_08815 [Vibrio sp. 10N.286.49.B3]|uniref:STAS/SEC14 domain-containing protein n=1 Tax=Vibrio sp. 10N.286.49.B3 TaxID=1880855 RepID=UPI000C860E0D|nr:STAS/SEC14 domain-containing protein [Vibrio sp. 10N.286.49.B3]PMH46162.1 hypothetical protein BCU68_08815 [Vibrio sp. 10N.286.49.B3]